MDLCYLLPPRRCFHPVFRRASAGRASRWRRSASSFRPITKPPASGSCWPTCDGSRPTSRTWRLLWPTGAAPTTPGRWPGGRVLPWCAARARAGPPSSTTGPARPAATFSISCTPTPTPRGFLADLRRARRQGYGSGCYRLAFDHGHWFLRFSAWCTRLPLVLVRFGDQSLFVQRELFA